MGYDHTVYIFRSYTVYMVQLDNRKAALGLKKIDGSKLIVAAWLVKYSAIG